MLDCIILVGGLGTRLKQTVPDLPKPLAPINGTPFLDILIKKLSDSSLTDKIVLAIGYKGSYIQAHYSQQNIPSLCYSIEKTLLGTGGALKQALSFTSSEYVLVMNGDSYLNVSFKELFQFHLSKKADITLAYVYAENANRYGQLTIDPQTSQIYAFKEKSEKPRSGYINGGVYLINKKIIEELPLNGTFSLEKDAFPLLLNNMYGFAASGTFIDIGTPESYREAQDILYSLTNGL